MRWGGSVTDLPDKDSINYIYKLLLDNGRINLRRLTAQWITLSYNGHSNHTNVEVDVQEDQTVPAVIRTLPSGQRETESLSSFISSHKPSIC